MLAGEFVAGAGAFDSESYGVGSYQIESAALAFTPNSFGILTKVFPVTGIGQLLAVGS